MQKFSIAPNGLSDGERGCKAEHQNNSSTAPENNVLQTSTHSKEYEKKRTGVASGEAIKLHFYPWIPLDQIAPEN